jgi:putative membrane protein
MDRWNDDLGGVVKTDSPDDATLVPPARRLSESSCSIVVQCSRGALAQHRVCIDPEAVVAPLALVVTWIVAVLHVVFMVFETFLWTTPRGRKIFGQTKEGAEATKVLAANQGVYNGALAGALGWSALTHETHATMALLVFVIVVGVVGAVTAKPSILFLQALPAVVALVLTWLA